MQGGDPLPSTETVTELRVLAQRARRFARELAPRDEGKRRLLDYADELETRAAVLSGPAIDLRPAGALPRW